MLGIERPHLTLRVEQTESTFAEGNARWCVLGLKTVFTAIERLC